MKDLLITGLIVCAGKSSRMGDFKPLMKYQGKTMLQNVISKLETFCEKIIIVTGYKSKPLKKELVKSFINEALNFPDYKIQFVENKNYEMGMFTSLQVGLSIVNNCDWVLYHFVDQPGLPIDFYKDFIDQIDNLHNWIQPVYGNKNGHPVLFNKQVIDLILNSNENSNLRELSKNSIVKKKRWGCYYEKVLQDIDTLEDYLSSINPDN